MPAIQVEDVYKVFGRNDKEALEMLRQGVDRDEVKEKTGAVGAVLDASFEVQRGEIFVVMGLSGSGKSTLVRTINRLFEPTAGKVTVDGEDVTALDSEGLRELRATKISMVFQHFGLFPHRTVRQNAAWGLEVRHVEEAERVAKADEALEMVGLGGWGDSFPGQLSGGMQQRVGLARALASGSDILLMDEAFSALDPLIRSEMQEQLVELQDTLQKTIVFITHDLNEAMFLGDRIAMMKDGRIVQIGTSEDILKDPANEYVSTFVADVDRSRVLTARAVMEEPITTILRREGPKAAARAMRQRQVSALFVVDPGRKLVGAALDDEVIAAVKRGETSLDNITHTDVPTVEPDTQLVEILATSAESRLPLPVVENGKLIGVIPRVTLLAALGGDSDAGAPHVPPEHEDEPTSADEPADGSTTEGSVE
jgi:glycine betaine/proline transport system ATP-binding protein